MRAPARALYRGRQLFSSLRPRVDASLRDEALGLLREPERRLFESMTPRDQQHGIEVYRRLRDAGHDDAELVAAALLHDCGKGRVATWHRVAFVALAAAAPALLRRAASRSDGAGWRAALYRCLHHEALGAQRARAAGAQDRVVALIRGDEAAAGAGALLALRTADDAS